MELGLKGKVVAITGGTSGIGKAVAEAFAKEGANIAVCGRSPSKIEAVEKYFHDTGYEIYAESVDVAVNEQLEHFAASVEQKFGRIDIWINNAGINIHKGFEDITEAEWQELVNTDFKSVFYGSAIAAKYMRKVGGGVIINTSSFTSIIPTAGKALYSAVKSGVNSLTRSFAAELAADGIRVVAVIPGYTVTPLTEKNIEQQREWLVSNIGLNRLATVDDMIGGYLFLASDRAAYISGICLEISGAKFVTQNPRWSWNKPTIMV